MLGKLEFEWRKKKSTRKGHHFPLIQKYHPYVKQPNLKDKVKLVKVWS